MPRDHSAALSEAIAPATTGALGFGARSRALFLHATHSIWRLFALEQERRRPFVWLPVAFGIGILLYFAADREPALWAPLLATGLAVAGVAAVRRRPLGRLLMIGVAFVFAGFSAACMRTALVAAPVLTRVTAGKLTGFVVAVDDHGTGSRLVIVPTSFAELAPQALPALVRVTVKSRTAIKPGDHVRASARLLPPPEQARPGGYDFARDAYFKRLGAVGSVSGAIELTPATAAPPRSVRWAAAVDAARATVTTRIATAFGGQAGAVAAALVTGKRGQITEDTNEVLRAAGIYHIVSISGLHMVLAASVFFWSSRALLALLPGLALAWPIKKIAAALAMVGAAAYCIFTGSDVATERALVMTLVMLGAILVERPALAMRNLAIAALIVLAMEPESLLGPSFQMSFAAVAGLIAVAERSGSLSGLPRPRDAPPLGPVGRAGRALLAAVTTTAVAELATGSFSAYHFQALSPLGILGNVLTLPFISLVVMPSAVVGMVAYPFGIDWPIWWVMGLATEPILWASRLIATIEQSRVGMPAMSALALAGFVIAILWFTLWSTALRWAAVVPAAVGLVLAAHTPRPDILVDRRADGAAVRGADGRLVILGKPSSFVVEQWLRADGDRRLPTDPSLRAGTRCDSLGCVGRLADGGAVAFVVERSAFEEDCARADVVISRRTAPPTCAAALVLDGPQLTRAGAVAVNAGEGVLRTTTARGDVRSRPWINGPAPPKPKPLPEAGEKLDEKPDDEP
ncbi:ComEC/Rec2 family competence protein [Chelatococcus reniformis]|uniref:Competence protein ComEC n=1 Tax=Chelatococcus reniformis TaxID=1494448 RepID=A0A916UE01_9HYPH|nr:ComEC/Rec2 family competence protein [Chelatococcus reniformis]GGC69519.1 competence protein ComEC [Chelatococcus reniformis]